MEIEVLNQLENLRYDIRFEKDGECWNVIFNDSSEDILIEGFNKYAVLPIYSYNREIENHEDVEVKNDDGELIAVLCFACYDKRFDVGLMTVTRYLSYLIECEHESLRHSFLRSYLFVPHEKLEEYNSVYKKSAPLWGGYTHKSYSRSVITPVNSIVANKRLVLPLAEHQRKLNDAVHCSNGYDRFIKKYHLLEMMFDYITFLKVKTGHFEIGEMRKVVNTFDGEEFTSLRKILQGYVDNINELLEVLYKSTQYENIVNELLQDYSKSSNPLNTQSMWNIFWGYLENRQLSFTYQNTKTGQHLKDFTQFSDETTYNNFILKEVAYWIYRTRCSIVHSKIGEYMFNEDGEAFVIEIVEKILDILIKEIYSNESFIELINKARIIDNALATSTTE